MVMPIIRHTLPKVVAIGGVAHVTEKAIATTKRKRTTKPIPKKRKATLPIKRKAKKQKPVARVKTRNKIAKTKLPPGKWAQLSREELVHVIGKVKADKVKAANGKAVKVGMYDRAIYINGKYYLKV
jgi:hypothetical protein